MKRVAIIGIIIGILSVTVLVLGFPLEDPALYIFWTGVIQAICFLLLIPLFLPIGIRLPNPSFGMILWAYCLFNLNLLLWGCVGNSIFLHFTYHKLYFSVDSVVDWYPFIPFGQWVLDQSLGDSHGSLLNGATLWQLRWIWFAVALPVWVLTYASTWYALQLCRWVMSVAPFAPRLGVTPVPPPPVSC